MIYLNGCETEINDPSYFALSEGGSTIHLDPLGSIVRNYARLPMLPATLAIKNGKIYFESQSPDHASKE